MPAFFYSATPKGVQSISVAALNLGHILRHGYRLAIENSHLTADKLHRLPCGSAGILAPDLSTVVEDTGRQRFNGCDMVLSHSAFLLHLVDC